MSDARKRFTAEVIPTILFPKAIEKINWHKENGHRVIVVTASCDAWLGDWTQANGVGNPLHRNGIERWRLHRRPLQTKLPWKGKGKPREATFELGRLLRNLRLWQRPWRQSDVVNRHSSAHAGVGGLGLRPFI